MAGRRRQKNPETLERREADSLPANVRAGWRISRARLHPMRSGQLDQGAMDIHYFRPAPGSAGPALPR